MSFQSCGGKTAYKKDKMNLMIQCPNSIEQLWFTAHCKILAFIAQEDESN